MSDTNDHDLLIELRTEMRGLRTDVTNLSSNTTERIKDLELTKFSSKEYAETWGKMINDHEARLRSVETIMNQSKGGAYVIQGVVTITVSVVVSLILKHFNV